MTSPKFRVAISGGGIGGLCLAVALCKYADIQVDLYEAAAQFKEIGAGVMIWSRTWEILSQLGMEPQFAQIAHAPPDGSIGVGFDFRKSDQPKEGQRFHLFQLPYGCIRFHRAPFLDVLVDHLPAGVAQFGKRLLRYSQDAADGLTHLYFGDNTTTTCDVLIGCDGIRSTVRKQMFEQKVQMGQPELSQYIDPIWTGTIAYRGLIPVERLKPVDGVEHRTIETPMMYCGQSKHVVSYSISKGSVVNVVALASRPEMEGTTYDHPWVVDCPQAELLNCYDGWEPEVVEMLKWIDAPTRWAIYHLRPLPTYIFGKVALLGDAAHAMSPHQGAGAGQAIEDAFVLAHILGHPSTTLSTLSNALRAYEHVRLPFANHIISSSYESGMMYEFNGHLGLHLQNLGPAIEKQWDWLSDTSPADAVEKAMKWLQKNIDQSTTHHSKDCFSNLV